MGQDERAIVPVGQHMEIVNQPQHIEETDEMAAEQLIENVYYQQGEYNQQNVRNDYYQQNVQENAQQNIQQIYQQQ